jgi:Putative adhesin
MSNNLTTPTATEQPPSAGRPGRNRHTTLLVLAAVLAVLLVGFGALTLASLLARSHGHVASSYSGISRVDVDVDFESVHVTRSDSGLRLDRSYAWSIGRPTISQHRVGDRLVVSSTGCGFTVGLGCTGSVRLAVPAGVTLHLHTDNSEVSVRDVDGDVDAATSNGEVRVSGTSGDLRLHSSNGRISGTGLRSARVDASTSNGGVELVFLSAPDRAVARTSNGDIDVTVPDDGSPYKVDATTSNGSHRVSVPTDGAASRSIEAHTSNGSVQVRNAP